MPTLPRGIGRVIVIGLASLIIGEVLFQMSPWQSACLAQYCSRIDRLPITIWARNLGFALGITHTSYIRIFKCALILASAWHDPNL